MKFRQVTATIAIYFLFTLLWFTLNSFASKQKDSQSTISTVDHGKIPDNSYENLPLSASKLGYLNKIDKNVLSDTIVNQFLTMQDILIFRGTCKNFQILLQPNRENGMVMFCKNLCSEEEIEYLQLAWIDLKHFHGQSYYTAFKSFKMFNIKIHQYAMVMSTPDKKIISWFNTETPYPEIIFYETFLYDPEKIYNKYLSAWAKITKNGNVGTGGEENEGGKIPDAIQPRLKNVKMIYSTKDAFAALLKTGDIITWGNVERGGKISSKIQNVAKIYSTNLAFAALLVDGSVFAWGDERDGGKIPDDIQTHLKHVTMIYSTTRAFAALLVDGSVFTWGYENFGGKIPVAIQPQLKNVKMIYSNGAAFAALLNDGSVFAWGLEDFGGFNPHAIQPHLKNVTMIYSTNLAFAALLNDGSVFAWGEEDSGGKIPDAIQPQLKNVNMIYFNSSAFAALLEDGSVFAWGDKDCGGEIPDHFQPKLFKNVTKILPKSKGFAAYCKDGDIIEWGETTNIQKKIALEMANCITTKNGKSFCNIV